MRRLVNARAARSALCACACVCAAMAPSMASAQRAPAPVRRPVANDDGEPGARVTATAPPSRGASDNTISVGRLGVVPRGGTGELMRLAPGIFLSNGLGEGHADQVFLRGFDARLGQDLEFTVEGMPLNEPGHPHGHGHADTHTIIPELVDSLRVLEGPFDPRQGDFAVAGSAQFTLRVRERGARVQYRVGTYGSHRVLGLWAPDGELSGTFGAVELARSDGFGSNRSFERATVNAGYERRFGSLSMRLVALSYLSRYGSAGVLREDDYAAGRVPFYGTYDATQGGETTRHSLSATLESVGSDGNVFGATAWGAYRTFRLRENYTGFLLDTQQPGQSPHEQRGDGIEQTSGAADLGLRASGRFRTTALGQRQSLEIGAYARFVATDSVQQRMRFGTSVPYSRDFDFDESLGNIALYADADLRATPWLALRGGVRADLFFNGVLDRCAVRDTYVRGAPLDQECLSVDRSGYRSPTQRRSASGLILQPRASLLVGPFKGLTASVSVGRGTRSADPTYPGDGQSAPFSPITAAEAGVVYSLSRRDVGFNARALGYYTHVDSDLVFNEAEGRNSLATGTSRMGALVAARLTTPWLDVSTHVTYARATFDDDGRLVPYVPPLVFRLDAAVNVPLPAKLRERHFTMSAGIGATYVAPRPLPLSEIGDAVATIDASFSLRWTHFEFGLWATNILDAKYRWGQFNFVSDFHSQPFPTLVATRHFTAGNPMQLALTFTIHLGARAARHGGPTTP